jgi:hypothetical protein
MGANANIAKSAKIAKIAKAAASVPSVFTLGNFGNGLSQGSSRDNEAPRARCRVDQ